MNADLKLALTSPQEMDAYLEANSGQEIIDHIKDAMGARETLHFARPLGATLDSMRKHVWETGLADRGDTILIWVNEGDLWHLPFSGVRLEEHKNPEPMPPVPGPNIRAESIDR